jgi:hypothetical protein
MKQANNAIDINHVTFLFLLVNVYKQVKPAKMGTKILTNNVTVAYQTY